MLFLIDGSWMLNEINASGVNYKLVDFPVYDGNTKGHWASSHQFSLPRNSKRDAQKTAGALDFINFIGEQSMMWAEAGQIPARTAIAKDARFQTFPQAFIANAPASVLKVYTYPYYGYAVEALDKVLTEILYGRMAIDAGLRQAEQETIDRIKAGG
jgi:multiple sugar transport system substrate-binding protein